VTTYVLRRLLLALPTLVGVSLVAFLLVAWAPGDPVKAILGDHYSEDQARALRAQLGLDDPLPVRYLRWAGGVLRGDLGTNDRTKRPITEELAVRWPATAELATAALLLATLVGVTAGVTAATRRGSLFDQVAMGGALTGVSLPIFWLAGIMLVIVTRAEPSWPTGLRLPSTLFDYEPLTGFTVLDAALQGRGDVLRAALRHLALPAVALGTIPTAIISRMTRSSMLETLAQDYVRTARAKGLARRRVDYRHALRNALIPVITVIGLQVGLLMAGAILTETIFSWNGVGQWIVNAIGKRDYVTVQGGLLLLASVVMVVNLLVDLLYGLINPRIRHAR
jgi:dipeptide transport system permease protein